MVSRSGMISPPVRRTSGGTKQQAASRRVDVRLGANTELKLRGVAVPRVGWRMLSLVILAALGMLLFWMLNAPQFTVSAERVTVNGISRIDKDSLLAHTGILNLPIFLVDPGQLTERLPVDVPALESVEVSVTLGGELVIDAVERVPVVAWDQEMPLPGMLEQVSWVDMQGRIFPAIGSSENLVKVSANDAPPIPPSVLTAAEQAALDAAEEDETEIFEDEGKEQLLAPDLVQNLLVLAASLPEGSALVYDGTYGFGWEDPTFGWMVYFGKHLDQPELRLKIYQTVAATFLDKQRQPALISVAYLNAPYYRMEP